MEHGKYREWLQLYLYDELTVSDRVLLETHLKECEECGQELEDQRNFHSLMKKARVLKPSEQLLREARARLHDELQNVKPKTGYFVRFFRSAQTWSYRYALAAAAMFAFGLLAGYFVFLSRGVTQPAPVVVAEKPAQADPFLRGDVKVSNLRFLDADASDGEVEFQFEAVAPVTVKGNINDDRVQKVLTRALVSAENPGVRLRAVNAFSEGELNMPDLRVKTALITALKTDENAGVRKEAFTVLQKFPFDEEIKQAFLHVLEHDGNPGLRIEAIKAFQAGNRIDSDVREVLEKKVETDNNNYIRTRARAVLEGVHQP